MHVLNAGPRQQADVGRPQVEVGTASGIAAHRTLAEAAPESLRPTRIHGVAARPDARAGHGDQRLGGRTVCRGQQTHRPGDDARTLPPGMQQGEGPAAPIVEKDRQAVGHGNGQQGAGAAAGQAVRLQPGELQWGAVTDRDDTPGVHLPAAVGGTRRHAEAAEQGFAVRGPEALVPRLAEADARLQSGGRQRQGYGGVPAVGRGQDAEQSHAGPQRSGILPLSIGFLRLPAGHLPGTALRLGVP